jgi:hypothetical protein
MPPNFQFFPPIAHRVNNPHINVNPDMWDQTALKRTVELDLDPENKRDFEGAKNRNLGFGPVSAFGMSSGIDVGVSPGDPGVGYGNSNYGAKAYGESYEIKFPEKEKPILENLESKVSTLQYFFSHNF